MSTAAKTRVAPSERFTRRTQDCPVCQGNADHAHGQGTRCYGYVSDDGRYAFCTREDLAAAAPRMGDTYRHWLGEGACRCGRTHTTTSAPLPAIRGRAEPLSPRVKGPPA